MRKRSSEFLGTNGRIGFINLRWGPPWEFASSMQVDCVDGASCEKDVNVRCTDYSK